MLDKDIDELKDWTFPDVMEQASYEEDYVYASEDNINIKELISKVSQKEVPAPVVQEDQNKELKEELEKLKSDYQEKLLIINHLMLKLKNPASIIEEQLIELINDIVKKVTKKIILKEIVTEPYIVLKIIDELKALMQTNDGIISVYLSENDFKRLGLPESNNEQKLIFNIKSDLADGDIILKSNFTEIRALLDERIEQLIRVQHE